MFGLEWKSRGMEKMSLYKFTHIPLFKNDAQLKQKSEKQAKKKKKSCKKKTRLFKKKKKSLSPHALENQKKK